MYSIYTYRNVHSTAPADWAKVTLNYEIKNKFWKK